MRLMWYFREKYLKEMKGVSILDVGSRCVQRSFKRTYRELFEADYKYHGMDVEAGENVDIVGYENIRDVYDVVISGQTMEHVKRPWEWLKNLVPYFKKYICIIAPHAGGEHRYPIDTYRYMPDGMRDLFEYVGIKEIKIAKDKILTMGIGTK